MVDMLEAVHGADGSAERDQWCMDNWSAVTAHIGVAARMTSGTASNMLLVGIALRERFPKVSALFSAGLVSYQVVRAMVFRSANVVDPDALRSFDEQLSQACQDWEPLSVDKTEKTIDAIIAEVDPLALRRREAQARDRGVAFGTEDGSGITTLFATLFATDATALETRLQRGGRDGVPRRSADHRSTACRCVRRPGPRRGPAGLPLRYPGLPGRPDTTLDRGRGLRVTHQDTLDARPETPPPRPDEPEEPVAPREPEPDAQDAAADERR